MGWREMSAGCLPAYAFGGYIAACAKVMTVRKVGHGLPVCTRIVYGSTISTDSIGLKFDDARIFGSFTRSILNFADSALNSSPLVNLTPLRSLTSHVVGPTSFGISVASPGTILRLGSRSQSVSKICAAMIDAGASCWFMMSSVVGSTPCAITTLPAGAAAAAARGSSTNAATTAVTLRQWIIWDPPTEG